MEPSAPRLGLTNITAAVVLLVAALAIVISWSVEDWNLLLPVFLLGLGIYIMAVGLYQRSGGDRLRRMDASYMMFWGSLMVIIGALMLANYYYPGNLLLLFVVFIVWLAGAIIIFSIRPKGP